MEFYRLPGGAPESHVFDTVIEAWPQIGGKLSGSSLKGVGKSEFGAG